ncbi:MAG: DNA polymerase IV [bacterium]|nr:DNA polymerase IV [bacterium]
MEEPRAILHVDMDAFYASVEVLDDPSLRGLPVIVGGTPEGRGVVSAASYEARRYGVHSAMSAARARQLCPDGVFLRGRMERYAEISAAIFDVMRDFTPLVEPLSIDEAFLDVTGCRRLFGPPERLGRAVKDRIAADLGLTASVGLAPNKFLAKLASDLDKPDGFVVVPRDDVAGFLAPLEVTRLWGVGPATAKLLADMGIHKVADLLAHPRGALVDRWGDHARKLLELAVGRDERPVIPDHEAKSIGNETTFAVDVADQEHLEEILDHLADKVARRLRRHGLSARTVTLKARYTDFETHTRSATLPEATERTVVIRDAARDLLRRRLGRRGRPLRLVGVMTSNLTGGTPAQGKLFADPEQEHQRTLDQVMDRVHERFGAKLRRGLNRDR